MDFFFFLRREAALAFFDPDAGLADAAFASSGGTDGDCEAGPVGCDRGGWGVWVSVLCAGDGGGVVDKNGNKKKIAARVIQESRAAVQTSYAFARNVTYELPRDPG